MRALAVCVLLIVLLPRPAAAEPPEVTRVLRTFDFEERRLGNEEDLPMHWLKVEGPGLPHYVNGRLSDDRAHSGKYSFRFDLNGGSLIYQYQSGQIPVQQGAHYRIEGYCQTTVLPNARARLTAYFTDLDGHLLPDTVRHSEPYAAKTPDEPWHLLSVELSEDDPRAGYLVLQLELLQPGMFMATTLGQRALFAQDIHGSAWFDDVTVSQVPKVTLSTDRPGNIFPMGVAPRLKVLVNDRFTDDLQSQLILTDATGATVYQRSGALNMQTAVSVGPGTKELALDLPALPPGWYEASLAISSQGQPLGAQKLAMILLADDGSRGAPDPRFGVIATNLPFAAWSDLPRILPLLSAGRVKLALWSEAGDVQEMDPAAFDHLLATLQELNITPTACLLGLPPAVARQVGGNEWDRLLGADPSKWEPQLSELIARHANHLDRWQLGADGSDAFVTDPKMRQVYDKVYRRFTDLVTKPDLAMPWPAWYEMQGKMPATVALSVPGSVLPSQLPLYTEELRNAPGHNLSLSLELLDAQRYGRVVQIRDLAQRVVYALGAGATRIDLPMPFDSVPNGDGGFTEQPQELFMILRTLTTLLSGATYQGRVPVAEGVEAFLFDRDGEGVLALWTRGDEGGVKSLALNLGDEALRVDLWGNVTPLFNIADSTGGDTVPVSVGPDPIFLVNIDGQQAQLRATVAVDQPLLESSFEPHTRHIRFTNTYRQAIGGSLKLQAPKGWIVNPPTFQFTLNPGETFDREFTMQFPYNSFAGPKTLECQFNLSADRNSTFTVPVPLQLGLSDVGMQSLALRDGNDVVVQQMITNYGEQPISYTAFAIFPGQPRQERLVANLAPGRTLLKRYRFANVRLEASLHVRVGVKELDGMRILNEDVEVH
jgi:hypothetical protein